MTSVAAMKEMHGEAHQRKEPKEPGADEDLCPMLGDEQESCDSEKADEDYPHF